MKKLLAAFLVASLSTFALAQAQAPVPATRVGSIDSERERISAERTRLEAGFSTEDAACYKKFAVNNCLRDVNTRRREAMADLRRQEILLNDEERRIKGAEQIRKTEEKSSPEKQQEAADRRAKALEDYQSRLAREKEKQQNRATAQAGEKASSEASANKLENKQQKTQARTDRQAAAAEETAKFNARQKEARERRAQHESDQLKRTKPPAKSLPLPE
jgi:colicin import membrane protein